MFCEAATQDAGGVRLASRPCFCCPPNLASLARLQNVGAHVDAEKALDRDSRLSLEPSLMAAPASAYDSVSLVGHIIDTAAEHLDALSMDIHSHPETSYKEVYSASSISCLPRGLMLP